MSTILIKNAKMRGHEELCDLYLKDGVFASNENTETVSGPVEVPAQSALILRMVSAEN